MHKAAASAVRGCECVRNHLQKGGYDRHKVSKRQTILIVEDDADLRRVWRLALQLEGYDVEEAGDGIAALRHLDNHPPDLVVLDLGLPALDGLSVQQEIAAHAVTRAIPIVIVTGSGRDLSHVDVNCVLRKPIGPDQLVETVRRCMASGAPGVVRVEPGCHHRDSGLTEPDAIDAITRRGTWRTSTGTPRRRCER